MEMSKTKHNTRRARDEENEQKYVKRFKTLKDNKLATKHFNTAIRTKSVKDIIRYSEEM